jgi:hypothetical protein
MARGQRVSATADATPSDTARRGSLAVSPCSGIEKSESKIAPDVDVRADGSYAIWWPRQGLAVIDHPLAAWPDWLLVLALGRVRVRARSRNGEVNAEVLEGARTGVPHVCGGVRGDQTLNFRARVKSIQRKLEQAQQGNRNATLFWAACRLAEIVAEDKLRVDVATKLLESSCHLNGLWRDPEDGPERCRATIASAFHNVEQGLLSEPSEPIEGGTERRAPYRNQASNKNEASNKSIDR